MSYRGEIQANTQITVKIGPFLDDSDGNTNETGLSISQADIRLSKNGGNFAQVNHNQGGGNLTHDELGYYDMTLDTTDTNTEGRLLVVVHESGALLVELSFNVVAQAAHTSKFTAKDTGYMDVNVKAVSEDTTASDNLELITEISNITSLNVEADGMVHADVKEVGGTAQTANDNGADINAILTDTNELQTDLTNGGRLDLLIDAIKAVTDALTAAAAAKLALSAGTIVSGTVSHDNSAATTTELWSDDITEATADHYNGRIIIFTSDALQYQATDITDYELDTGEGHFTYTAVTEAPADNSTFIIV